MFHLCNKVYLSFDFAKMADHDYIVVSRKWGALPYDPSFDPHVKMVALTYADILNENFLGSPDGLIQYITTYPKEDKLTIYCDEEAFAEIMARWLFALLPNADDDVAYTAYKLTVDKMKYIHSQVSHSPSSYNDGYEGLQAKDAVAFKAMYNGMTKPKPLTALERESTSLEWLIATHLANPDCFFTEEADKRIRKIVWKLVGWEVNELKRNLMNGMLDLSGMFETVPSDIHPDVDVWEMILGSEPRLKFLQDRACSPHNIEIIKTYGLGFFTDMWKTYMSYMGNPDEVLEAIFNVVKQPDYSIDEILEVDMSRKFGTQLFARTEYRFTMNPMLISYFYRLKRKGYSAELNKFSLEPTGD